MQFAMCDTVLCLVLVISAVSAHVIPTDEPSVTSPAPSTNKTNKIIRKDSAEIMHHVNETESELGGYCKFNELEGTCTEMEYCAEYNDNRTPKNVKDVHDPCTNVLQHMIICCSSAIETRPTARADTSVEASSKEVVEGV
uniref:Uncharacterized protein n=1 Tax=Anopheles culicifacies TaxID=139723 RepID=A0A182MTG5_9DIPT